MYATIDIGGTKTLIIMFDEHANELEQIKFPTPESYDDFLIEMEQNVAKLSTNNVLAVGVAAPGKVNHHAGTLVAAGNLTWRDAPLQRDIQRLFNAPVVIENDAKTAALSEARSAGPDYQTVVYITVSTGIGIGVCEDGKLVPALEDAEMGWMEIEHNGHFVPWEKFASGSAIVATYGKRASDLNDPVAWDTIARNIAKGLITIIAMVQPDLIVFGGGVGNHLEKFETPLKKHLASFENPMVKIPTIIKSAHPEEAVAYGCLELAKDFAAQR